MAANGYKIKTKHKKDMELLKKILVFVFHQFL